MVQLKVALCLIIVLVGVNSWSHARRFGRCGYRPKSSSRIVGGQDAGLWPWQAQILKLQKNGHEYQHKCGGTLLNRKWVVTSASCLFEDPYPTHYRVKLGEYDRSKKERGEQEFDVADVRLHRGFLTQKQWGNDIALIKLKGRARLTRRVRPACLPIPRMRIELGTLCYMTGWGKPANDQDLTTILQEAALPVVSHTQCDLRNAHLQKVDDKAMLCAGYDNGTNISGCKGDSGGPLVCKEGRKWILRGVTSWGDFKCDGTAAYSVFSRVSSFVHWIYRTMMIKPRPPHRCQDNHWYCGHWEEKGLCTHVYYKNSLKMYCPVTCGYCKKGWKWI